VSVQLLRPESVEAAAAALGNGSVGLAGGTDLVPLLRDRLVEAETLVELQGVVPRGIDGTRIGAGTTLAELEVDPESPEALREACPSGGVAAARFADGVKLALAGAAPIPWRLDSEADLDRATPLPGTAYKVELARPLIRRALQAVS